MALAAVSEAASSDDENDAVDMIKRMSQAPSVEAVRSLQQQQQGSAATKKQLQKQTSKPPPEATRLSGIMEDDDDGMDILDFGVTPASDPMQNAAAADALRDRAEQADSNADRYTQLIQESAALVSEVKTAMYDADHSGQAFGAEVLLDEVRGMLSDIVQNKLVEAAALQKPAEQLLGIRKTMTKQLKANHDGLHEIIRRRAELTRQVNEESRAECEGIWMQIRAWETELEDAPKVLRSGPASDYSRSPPADVSPAPAGMTLEGAHSLLRAFAAVLAPHMSTVIPRDPSRRSATEAVANEFLTACSESMQQVRAAKSPPPFEAQTLKRCDSSPGVIHGDRVETDKPAGLLPMPSGMDPTGGLTIDLPFEADEQNRLLAQLGQSF